MSEHAAVNEQQWLFHIDEKARALVCNVLEQAVTALRRVASTGGPPQRGCVLNVPRAIRLNGRTRGVRVLEDRGRCEIQYPINVARRDRLIVLGPCYYRSYDSPSVLDATATSFAFWLERFREPATPDSLRAPAQVMRRLTEVLLGAVLNHGVDWRAAYLFPGPPGHHHVAIIPTEERGGRILRFATYPKDGKAPTMSPQLVQCIDEIQSDYVHVVATDPGSPDRMPSITIGRQPTLHVESDQDPMAILRALASLPENARLIGPPRRRIGQNRV